MKYFKDDKNAVYAYEDDVEEKFVKIGLVAITEADALILANPEPTKSELITLAEQKKTALRVAADAEIIWRQDAVDAGIATDEEASSLAAWKKYRVMLMRVDTSKPEWPDMPE